MQALLVHLKPQLVLPTALSDWLQSTNDGQSDEEGKLECQMEIRRKATDAFKLQQKELKLLHFFFFYIRI